MGVGLARYLTNFYSFTQGLKELKFQNLHYDTDFINLSFSGIKFLAVASLRSESFKYVWQLLTTYKANR